MTADEMIQEAAEERAALDKVLSFLTGAAKAEVLTAEAWQETKVNLRFNGFSLAFAGAQALDAEQAGTISRTTSARKAKPGDLLITIDCRRCADSDDEVYDVLDSPTGSAGRETRQHKAAD